jgi:hypothetical protein
MYGWSLVGTKTKKKKTPNNRRKPMERLSLGGYLKLTGGFPLGQGSNPTTRFGTRCLTCLGKPVKTREQGYRIGASSLAAK